MADGDSDKARLKAIALRRIKYRLVFIFMLLPGLLVAAIVFNWVWELNLAQRMSGTSLTAVYAGLIGAFVAVFLVIGFVLRKRMLRDEQDILPPLKPIPTPAPIQTQTRPATPTNIRSLR